MCFDALIRIQPCNPGLVLFLSIFLGFMVPITSVFIKFSIFSLIHCVIILHLHIYLEYYIQIQTKICIYIYAYVMRTSFLLKGGQSYASIITYKPSLDVERSNQG